MVLTINNLPPPLPQPPAVDAPLQRPRVVADSISPAPAAKEKGFVELGVLALRDLVVWLFDLIVSIFRTNEPLAQASPEAFYREPPVLRPEDEDPAAAPDPVPAPALDPVPAAVPDPVPAAVPDPVPAPALDPVILLNPHQALLVQLYHIERGEDILRHFHTYFTTEEERAFIFAEIGRTAPSSWRHWIGQSYEKIGQVMVQKNPKLVLPSLINRVSQDANV